jgi:hypothetical protein
MEKMKNACILIILITIHFYAIAQSAQTIKVNAGDDIAAAISPNGIYRFPAFTVGTIVLKNGNQGTQLLNYNLLSEQIMYIDKNGDTLAIGIPDQVKKITIQDTGFYYCNNACVEEIANASAVSLVEERKIFIDYQKKGAFGNSDGVGTGTESLTILQAAGASYHLSVNQDAVIKKWVSYFLLTSDGQQLPATKSNFISVFVKNRDSIQTWLINNKVNFNKEQDLVKLFTAAAVK